MYTTKRTIHFLFAISLMQLAAVSYAATEADDGARTSITVQGLVSQGGTTAGVESSYDEYKSLELSGKRNNSAGSAVPQKSAASNSVLPNTEFWFYTADVELFDDRDRDGFYSGISLLFDADTYYEFADVYAVIYLSYEYGEWSEYAETEIFTILGASSVDEYVVETDLVAGYPTGSYDILVELYDAYDSAFVASIGPEDTSELSILPLEDSNRDTPATVTTQVIVSRGGGGSLSWFLLLGLAGAGALARKD